MSVGCRVAQLRLRRDHDRIRRTDRFDANLQGGEVSQRRRDLLGDGESLDLTRREHRCIRPRVGAHAPVGLHSPPWFLVHSIADCPTAAVGATTGLVVRAAVRDRDIERPRRPYRSAVVPLWAVPKLSSRRGHARFRGRSDLPASPELQRVASRSGPHFRAARAHAVRRHRAVPPSVGRLLGRVRQHFFNGMTLSCVC
jgi:hypothetical protein